MSMDVTRRMAGELPDPDLGAWARWSIATRGPDATAAELRASADALRAAGRGEYRAPWTFVRMLTRAETLIVAERIASGGDLTAPVESPAIVRRTVRDLGAVAIATGPSGLADWLADLDNFAGMEARRADEARAALGATANPAEIRTAAIHVARHLALAGRHEARAKALADAAGRARRALAGRARELVRTIGADDLAEDLIASRTAAGVLALEDPELRQALDAAEAKLRPLVGAGVGGSGRASAGACAERDRLTASLRGDRDSRLRRARSEARDLVARFAAGEPAAVTDLTAEVRSRADDFPVELVEALNDLPGRVVVGATAGE